MNQADSPLKDRRSGTQPSLRDAQDRSSQANQAQADDEAIVKFEFDNHLSIRQDNLHDRGGSLQDSYPNMPTDRNGSLVTNMTHKVVNKNHRTTFEAPYQTAELFQEVNQAGHPALGEESESMSMTEITAGHALSSQSNAHIATNNENGA